MRIVAGTLRGRAIEAPNGQGTRPTTDRVREALFSSLYSMRGGFDGAVVLDAFAGSGALGIEALSRGARQAMFIEADAKAASVLKRNLVACALEPAQAVVLQRDVLAAPPMSQDPPFDLVFLDPPYAYGPDRVLALVIALADSGSLSRDAIVVYEHGIQSRDAVMRAAEAAGLSVHADKKYGKTGITIGKCAKGPGPFAHL